LANGKYEIIVGEFPCHTCKVIVKSLRLYVDTKETTWLCPERHLSSVSFAQKKSRKNYE